MNKLIIVLSAIAVLFVTSCDKKSSGTEFDFSNSLPVYVDLTDASADTVAVFEGDTIAVNVNMRTAIQQPVTVYYNVSAPVNLTDQTIVIGKNELEATGTFVIPGGTVTDPSGSQAARLTVTKATTADGQTLTLGRYNDPASQTILYNISIP